MNKYDENKPRKPVIFEMPNKQTFRNKIYESNVIEFWKPITIEIVPKLNPNDNGRYWISTKGRIYDSLYQYLLPLNSSKGNKYYEQVNFRDINGKNFTVKVHRLELIAFSPIENYNNYQINHINGFHSDNYYKNLEWCTPQYNRYHAALNNLEDSVFGKSIVKLYPFEVRQIKELYNKNYTYKEIISILNLESRGATDKLISKILNGKSIYSEYL